MNDNAIDVKGIMIPVSSFYLLGGLTNEERGELLDALVTTYVEDLDIDEMRAMVFSSTKVKAAFEHIDGNQFHCWRLD